MSWPSAKLSDVCHINIGKTPARANPLYWGDGQPWLSIRDMGQSREITDTKEQITSRAISESNIKLVKQGTVLFSFKLSIGKIGIAQRDLYTNEAIAALPIKETEVLCEEYLTYALTQMDALKTTDRAVMGATLNKAKLAELKIPLPPLDEQKRIAAILDKADGLRRKREKAIQLTDTLLRAVFLDMFGDPVTNPKGFQMRTLKEFYADKKTGTKCGPFGSALKKDEYCKTGVPVWNMDNITKTGEFVPTQRLWITDEKFSALESYAVQNKDIIISRAGTVGKMCVVHTELSKSIISTNLIRLRLNENLSPEYFVCLMNYCKGRVGRLKTGPDGTFTHMNTGILDNLRFPYSPIKLQNEFIAVQDEFTKRSLKDQDYVKQASNLFSSLTQRAFSGELTG